MTAGERDRPAAELALRQLGVAFSTYRLYPGDVEQPVFSGAVARLGEVLPGALAAGPLGVVVRARRFHLDGGPVADDRADRLAEACFQRRVEHVEVRAVPSVADLDVFFDALVREPEEVEAAGGVGSLLAARGVRAVAASAGAPDPTSGRADPEEAVSARDSLDADERPPDPDAALPPLPHRAGESAGALYERLHGVHARLPDDIAARSTFFRKAVELAAGLTPEEQTDFAALVLDRAGDDPLAERYVGHLSDLELAAAIARVATTRSEDAVERAAELATVTGRHDALVRLVEAAVVAAARIPDTHTGPAERRLRDGFPADDADARRLALTTLRDYLASHPELAQVEQVMAAAAAQLRDDIGGLAPARVRALLATLDAARPLVTADALPLLAAPRGAALTPATLCDLAAAALDGEDVPAAALLEPFGPAVVGALVEALAAEHRRTVRGVLVGLLATAVADDPAQLEPHLDDERWYVVRNVATALRRAGGPAAAPLLERLALHPTEAVRQEGRHGLAALAPEHAAPAFARVAVRSEHRPDREASLRMLAELGGPVATRHLEELASARTQPRLSWTLRRQARALARRGGRR